MFQSIFNQADSMVDEMTPGWKSGDLLLNFSSSIKSLELSKDEKIVFGSTKSLPAWQVYNDHHESFYFLLASIGLLFYGHMKKDPPFIDSLLICSWVKQQRLLSPSWWVSGQYLQLYGRLCENGHNTSFSPIYFTHSLWLFFWLFLSIG